MSTKLFRYNLRLDTTFFQKNRSRSSKFFRLFVKKSDDLANYYSIIAPKKIFPLATERNYVKRKSLEALKQSIKSSSSSIYVLFPQKTVALETQDNLIKDLTKIIHGV